MVRNVKDKMNTSEGRYIVWTAALSAREVNFESIIDEWNSLPNDIKETVGISSFKHKVMSFLSNTYT